MYVYFSLGTNLGDKEHNLRLAVQKIEERIGKVISLFECRCLCGDASSAVVCSVSYSGDGT